MMFNFPKLLLCPSSYDWTAATLVLLLRNMCTVLDPNSTPRLKEKLKKKKGTIMLLYHRTTTTDTPPPPAT